MNFEIFQGKSQKWDDFLLEHHHEEFLQSFEWGEFQSREGKESVRICRVDQNEVGAQVQGFVHSLGGGMKYLYMPRVQNLSNEEWKALVRFFKTCGFVFVRVEPIETLQNRVVRKVKTHHRQYQYTSVLDLTQSNEELFKNFHEKTRYNIRLATKKGVIIKQEKNADIFYPLLKETYERDGIKGHSEKYYRDFIDLPACTQLTAYFENTPLASVLLYTFGKTCVYVHGASSNEYRNFMAPYLLQWEALEFARSHGCDVYDLGGVARPAFREEANALTFHTYSWDQTDKLSGVTRFKAGFNGTIKHYGEAVDVIMRPFAYRVYMLARKFF